MNNFKGAPRGYKIKALYNKDVPIHMPLDKESNYLRKEKPLDYKSQGEKP